MSPPDKAVDTGPAVQASARNLLQAWGPRRPQVAVLLGSGWQSMVQGLLDPIDVPYAELPAFPRLAIAGHAGCVRLARLPHAAASAGGAGTATGKPIDVMLMMGRQHAYEDGDAAAMRGAVQTVAALGCTVLVLTNAAGSLRADMPTGSLMVLSDHLNLVQRTPLVGVGGSSRFVDMSQAYDPALRALALAAARAKGVSMHEGVYAWVLGPQFETPAEIRMLQRLGADAVGMSTVPETIAARHAGLRVLGLSLITNMAAGLAPAPLSHEQTLQAAAAHESQAALALRATIETLSAP